MFRRGDKCSGGRGEVGGVVVEGGGWVGGGGGLNGVLCGCV